MLDSRRPLFANSIGNKVERVVLNALVTSGNSQVSVASSRVKISTRRYGRGNGVGRGRGVGVGLPTGVGETVGVGVGVGDGVAVGVGVGVGLAGAAARPDNCVIPVSNKSVLAPVTGSIL